MKKFTVLAILFSSFYANAQLSGTYTIGGVNPDYATIDDTRFDLIHYGISGNVTFNIRDGVYYESFYLYGGISVANVTDTLTFQSESDDSATVKIIAAGLSHSATFSLNQANYNFVLKNLTLKDSVQNGSAIENTYPFRSITITNCNILTTIYCSSVSQDYGVDFKLINSTCNNEVEIAYGSGGTIISSNVFSGKGYLNIAYKSDALIISNKFIQDTLSPQPSLMFAYSDSTKIINNIFRHHVDLGFPYQYLIEGNKFYKSLTLGIGGYNTIYDNFFYYNSSYPNIEIESSYNNICSNNFAPGLILDFSQDAYNNIFTNNNFPRYWGGLYNNTFINNNYQGSTIWWDSNPYNINPNYIDTLTDLHATNPQLIGRGVYLPTVLVDIDSLTRPNPPTIGANEICIVQNTYNLACGDSLPLMLCNFYNNPNIVWSPVNGLSNAHIPEPKASPAVTTIYYGRDSITGITDSITLNVVSYQVHTLNDTLIRCGDSILLDATLNAGVSYHWSPATGLSNPNIRRPSAKPSQTTTYVVTAINPACGNTIDSIKISVNPMPTAQFALSSLNYLVVGFQNQSSCADNYLWNFGDGDTSSVINPTHTYLLPGIDTVTLIACNSYGCDTISYLVQVTANTSGISKLTMDNSITISPNPFSKSTTITFSEIQKNTTIKIMDIIGKEIETATLNSASNFIIDKGTMPAGIYFVQIADENKNILNRKIVVQ